MKAQGQQLISKAHTDRLYSVKGTRRCIIQFRIIKKMDKKYETPFIWGIDEEMVFHFNENQLHEEEREEEDIPLLRFMNFIMLSFVYGIKANFNEAKRYCKKNREFWNSIDQDELQRDKISLDVILYIMNSTEHYVNKKIEEQTGVGIEMGDLDELSCNTCSEYLGTLYGCKSLAMSAFYEPTAEKACSFARDAILKTPDCSMWHFVLGKNLRRSRRSQIIHSYPSTEEMESFLESFRLSANPFFGIHAAQAHQENKNFHISNDIYNDIYNLKPKNCKIRLRLAMGFMKMKDFPRAKSCLGYVEELIPDSEMLLHYRGCFYMGIGDYQTASQYLKKAAHTTNFGANLHYGQCMTKLHDDDSYLLHLLFMLKKFQNIPMKKQHALLYIGMEYYKNKKYEESLKYFMQAIEEAPESRILKNFSHNDMVPLAERSMGGTQLARRSTPLRPK